MGSWTWIGRYVLVLVVAALLGFAIAELTVFKQATLGTPKLSAAALARCLGCGGALVMLAMLGHRTASQLRGSGSGIAHLGWLILPLTALVVLSAGYDIALAVLRPFLSAGYKDVYNWVFVFGISACAVWLVVALYQHSEGLFELLRAMRTRARPPGETCDACEAAMVQEAKFCAVCGKAAAE